MAEGKDKHDTLLFVDTNIFLDFYRAGDDAQLSLLRHLKQVVAQLISTAQVEMEFLKNRQEQIRNQIELIAKLKNKTKLELPTLLIDDSRSNKLRGYIKNFNHEIEQIRKRTVNLLRAPTKDDVHELVSSLFNNSNAKHLGNNHELMPRIMRKARRRFTLGYPPRKDRDTSIGDAVNWEWILHCASKEKPKKVILVSRDFDYGIKEGDEYFLNDFLMQEFRAQVGSRSSVTYTGKLSSALKQMDVKVTDEEEKAEAKAMSNSAFSEASWDRLYKAISTVRLNDELRALLLPYNTREGDTKPTTIEDST